MKKQLLGWILAVCIIVGIFPVLALAEGALLPAEDGQAVSTEDGGDAEVETPDEETDDANAPEEPETPAGEADDANDPEEPATADAEEDDGALAAASLDEAEDEDFGVTTADDFKTAIATGGTVKLGADIEISGNTAIAITATTTLDLNGHDLKITDTTRTASLFTINAGGALTLTDSGTEQNGKISVETCSAKLINVNDTTASFTMEGGTIEATKLSASSASLVYVTKGSFTMSGGTLTAGIGNKDAKTVTVSNASATFTMSDGVIEATNSGNVQLTALYIEKCTSASLTGGTVRSENAGTGACYNLWLTGSAKDVTLNGVTVEATAANGTNQINALYINNNAEVTAIKGNTTITASRTTTVGGDVTALSLNSGTAKIGSIEGTVTVSASTTGTGTVKALYTTGTIDSIDGGTYTAATAGANAYGVHLNGLTAAIGTLKNVTIEASAETTNKQQCHAIYNALGAIHLMTGGTYTAVTGLTNTGVVGMVNQELTESSSGVWTLTDVTVDETTAEAKIGETLYATLDGALGAAQEDNTVTLLQDLSRGNYVVNLSLAPKLTLDLNGHTITGTANGIVCVANATVTLTDSGTTKGCITTTGNYCVYVEAGGVLTANGVSADGKLGGCI